MPHRFSLAVPLGLALLATSPVPTAAADTVEGDRISFGDEIRPLLARRCFACHGPDESAGSLDLGSLASATGEQTDSGDPAIVPGDPAGSELMARITSHEEGYRMPEGEERLTDDEIALLRRWIAQGAEYQTHWAFVPPVDVEPPDVGDESWIRTPIDRFVLRRLERAGLRPAPEASRRTLIRRLSHDLIGLPPTPEQIAAFEADDRPDAYARLVDTLLASPHYGERWGRHWLDVVRFAETNSFERDGEKRNAWTFRDYVIDSFNQDRPYDQFLREQLAGDELVGEAIETGELSARQRSMLAATGFLRLGLWDDEPADPELHRFDQYDDLVRTVGEGMLGLTVGCARCHDHKIDPIPQRDYYEMVALVRGVPEFAERFATERFNQIETTTPEGRHEHERLDGERKRIADAMRTIEQRGIGKMPAPDQRASEGRGRKRVLRKLKPFLNEADWTEYQSLRRQAETLTGEQDALPPRSFVLGVSEPDPTPPQTHILERGSPQAPADPVRPAFVDLLGGGTAEVPPEDDQRRSSGRRTALADWVASNPGGMTARVMANRIWQHHFGRGLVRSANNFGQLGTPPTHPQLLDWLAAEFARRDWSIKAMHRLIVDSATYRMGTAFDEKAHQADPSNDLLWRFDIRRMDAEEVRDAVLTVSGSLNLEAVGGPSVYPKMPAEATAGQSRPGEGWHVSDERLRNRRSVYVFSKRSLPLPLFSAFDFPETDATCEGRFQTVQAGQALALLNSEFLGEQAEAVAARLNREVGDESRDQIGRLILLAYGRPATEQELSQLDALRRDLVADGTVADTEAMPMVCLAVLNTSEFLYIP